MIRPLLYLLEYGQLDDVERKRIVEELIEASQAKAHVPAPSQPMNILVITGLDSAPDRNVVKAALARYPELFLQDNSAARPLSSTKAAVASMPTTLPHDGMPCSVQTRPVLIMVNAGTDDLGPLINAMREGIPVLVPDSALQDADFVRDGFNGFLYRDHDPDSLALSIMTLRNLSQEILQRILGQARKTIAELLRPDMHACF